MKKVLLSYRYAGETRFDVVRDIASRLRFFSIEVVLDQRSLDYGEDIRHFIREAIHRADAVVLVVTEDYNNALLASVGPGEGVRFEVQCAIAERAIRPDFQIIPLLLDGVRPVTPFDQLKCCTPDEIEELITQLGLVSYSGESRVLQQRYRIDQLTASRGMARIFWGCDMVSGLPIEIYLVPAMDPNLRYRIDLFQRVVKGRSSAYSPFLLNIRDTCIGGDGSYYLITERFEGTDLGAVLAKGQGTHPFGALCLAFQLALAAHELHSVGVIHGGLAPRCVRLNATQTSCKIVDFEFATARALPTGSVNTLEGYPRLMPPERFCGCPASVAQDIYQIGNLVLTLICQKPAVSRLLRSFIPTEDSNPLEVDVPEFRDRLNVALLNAVGMKWVGFNSGNSWLDERVREATSPRFLTESLTELLAWCLAPNPEERPRTCSALLSALKEFGIPVVGHVVDPTGTPVAHSLFP